MVEYQLQPSILPQIHKPPRQASPSIIPYASASHSFDTTQIVFSIEQRLLMQPEPTRTGSLFSPFQLPNIIVNEVAYQKPSNHAATFQSTSTMVLRRNPPGENPHN